MLRSGLKGRIDRMEEINRQRIVYLALWIKDLEVLIKSFGGNKKVVEKMEGSKREIERKITELKGN